MKHQIVFYLALLWLIAGSCETRTSTGSLPRSTPEAEGVSSEAILQFLDAADTSKHEFHGFVFLRHGKVIAEAWWKPFASDLVHTLYSTSKSFTSTAVGFAVTENLLSVNDKIISFFPEYQSEDSTPLTDSIRSAFSQTSLGI